jgi:hypothetical protein
VEAAGIEQPRMQSISAILERSVGSVGDWYDPLELEAWYHEHQLSSAMVAELI